MLQTIVTGRVVRLAVLGMALAVAVAPSAMAGEGCGANRWRDRFGNCHWFYGPGGNNRYTVFECPPGTHIGPGGRACWPNR